MSKRATVECSQSPSGFHFWCSCTGEKCGCGKTICSYCDVIKTEHSQPETVLKWRGLECLNAFWPLHITECEYVGAPTRYQLRMYTYDFSEELPSIDAVKSLAQRLQSVLDSAQGEGMINDK